MELEFSGAAREVTGSCHILHVNGHTVLLDCGMFQGRRVESDAEEPDAPRPGERDRRGRALACAHRPLGAPPLPGSRRLRQDHLGDAGDARSLRDDARRLGAHPGEGRALLREAIEAGGRAAVLDARCDTRAGADGRHPVQQDLRRRAGSARHLRRRRPHPRLGVGRARLQRERRDPAAGLLRRHRPIWAADHPRSATARRRRPAC